MIRIDGRLAAEMRPITFSEGIAPHATGSVLVGYGNTRVICSAMIEEGVPRWMKEQQVSGGWLTAEYSMLPYAGLQRKGRDITRGKADGRSVEIQRLIGRALRAVVDLNALGPRTLWVDCDVLQADGGTRTASITGGCVAMGLAFRKLVENGVLKRSPLKQLVAAVSVGMFKGEAVLDLCYTEDRDASVDMNLVLTEGGEYVELQGSGEEAVFSQVELEKMLEIGKVGVSQLIEMQRNTIGI